MRKYCKLLSLIILLLPLTLLLGQVETIPVSIPPDLYKAYIEREKLAPSSTRYRTPEIYEDTVSVEKAIAKKEKEEEAREEVEEKEVFFEYIVEENDTIQVIKKAGPEKLNVFGSSFFKKEKETALQGVAQEPASPDYRLGPGDGLLVRLWGGANQEFDLIIDRAGEVFIPKAGNIVAGGYTLRQFTNRLKHFLNKIYSDFEISVTLTRMKSIKVFVMGRVENPGSYVLTGLSNILNALEAAGGPADYGSYRNIKLIRAGKTVAELDLYELFTTGKTGGNVQLAANDIVFVPPCKKKVKLRGKVNNPAIYELKEDEHLPELIEYAGGFLPSAFTKNIMIDRFHQEGHQIMGISAEDSSAFQSFQLLDGDDISVFPVSSLREKMISVRGAVVRPGAFALQDSMRLSQVVQKATPLPYAYLERVDIIRRKSFGENKLLTYNLNDISSIDPLLKDGDEIIVHSVWETLRKKYVTIDGAVKNPGKYEFAEGMKISDLVFMAGGVLKGAYEERVEVARVNQRGKTDIIYANLKKILDEKDSSEDILLQEDDRVFVRMKPEYQLQEIVTIEGEVRFPGKYAISKKGERLSDLIERVGGFTDNAFLKGAVFIRSNIEEDIKRRDIEGVVLSTQEMVLDSAGNITPLPFYFSFEPQKLGRLIIDLEKIVQGEAKEDIVLQDGDWIFVPPIPSGVSVIGAVPRQGTIKYLPDKNLRYYIERAGGFTRNADEDEVRIIKANGKVIKEGLGYKNIEPGDAIVIPQRIKRETDWGGLLKDSVSIISGIVTTLYILLRL